MTIAQGKAYSQTTRDWTEVVQYEARDRMEAIRWINFNRDWMKDLRIIENKGIGRIQFSSAGATRKA